MTFLNDHWLTYRRLVDADIGIDSRDTAFRVFKTIPPVFRRHRSHFKGRGKKGFEYHYLGLPLHLLLVYQQKHVSYMPGTDKSAARYGTGTLDTAEFGAVRALMSQRIVMRPSISATELRRVVVEYFGETVNAGRIVRGAQTVMELPPVRTFQAYTAVLKEELRPLFDNDDAARQSECQL